MFKSEREKETWEGSGSKGKKNVFNVRWKRARVRLVREGENKEGVGSKGEDETKKGLASMGRRKPRSGSIRWKKTREDSGPKG